MQEKIKPYYFERYELAMRAYRKELAKCLDEYQTVHSLEKVLGSKVADFESHIALEQVILYQIKQLDTMIRDYGKLDEPTCEEL